MTTENDGEPNKTDGALSNGGDDAQGWRRWVSMEALNASQLIQITAAAAFGLAAVRLITAAGGDAATGATILKTQGLVPLLFAIGTALIPYILLVIALHIIMYRGALAEANQKTWIYYNSWTVVVAIFLVAAYTRPWWEVAFYALLLIAGSILDRVFRKRARTSGTQVSRQRYIQIRRREFFSAVLASAVLYLPYQIANPTIWLPLEQISVENSNDLTGYILDTADPWTTVLIDSPRSISFVRTEDIARRTVCKDSGSPTIPELVRHTNTSPDACMGSD